MRLRFRQLAILPFFVLLAAPMLQAQQWSVHDPRRPPPPEVDPGSSTRPPADAVVLFDGKDLSRWRMKNGAPAAWKVENGYFEVVQGSGDLASVAGFGDCQLHVEWATPAPPSGEGQERGDSGVFLMGLYEVQVLDSYKPNLRRWTGGRPLWPVPAAGERLAPPGGMADLRHRVSPPAVRPARQARGPATMTVLHNGVLVQDGVELVGATAHKVRAKYAAHPDRLPLVLQDHGHPVRYRNVWVRELGEGGGGS